MKIDKNSLPENVRGLVNKTKIELLNIIDRKDHVEKELNTKFEVENKKAAKLEYLCNAAKKEYSDKCEEYNSLMNEHQKLQQDYLDLKEGYEELEAEDKTLLDNSNSLKNDIKLLVSQKQELEAINKTLNEKCNSLEKKNNTLLLDIKSISIVKENFINDNKKLSEDYKNIYKQLESYIKNNNIYKIFFIVYTIILIVFLLCNLM